MESGIDRHSCTFLQIEEFLKFEKEKLAADQSQIDFLDEFIRHKSKSINNQNLEGHQPSNVMKNQSIHDMETKQELPSPTFENSQYHMHNSFASNSSIEECRTTPKIYDREFEIERLALLFEKSPSPISYCSEIKSPSRENVFYDENSMNKKLRNYSVDHINKENYDPVLLENENSYKSMARNSITNNESKKTIVRFGEYSPLNSSFNHTNSSFLGFGEYEERRRAFLKNKKREYLENMHSSRKKNSVKRNEAKSTGIENQTSVRPIERLHLVQYEDFDSRLQKRNYKRELDEQVRMKKSMENERKHREEQICDIVQRRDENQRRDFMKQIENQYESRINALDKCKKDAEIEEASDTTGDKIQPSISKTTEAGSDISKANNELMKPISREINDEELRTCDVLPKKAVPQYLQNPLMKQSAESCAISDMDAFKKMQNELYKRELEKQIIEKRRIDEERKAKLKEEEEKLDRRIKLQAQKLREEYEEEEAKRQSYAAHIAQKNEVVKRVHENLKNDSKFLKPTIIRNTNHKRTVRQEKPKNVTFLTENLPSPVVTKEIITESMKTNKISSSSNDCHCGSKEIILNAPYVLATKPTQNQLSTQKTSTINIERLPCRNSSCSPSINSHINIIPPTVSMSQETAQRFFKSNTFSELSKLKKEMAFRRKS